MASKTFIQDIPQGIPLQIIREALAHYRKHLEDTGVQPWMEEYAKQTSEAVNYTIYDTMTLESLFHHPVQVVLTQEEVDRFEHLPGHMTGLPMYTDHPIRPQE